MNHGHHRDHQHGPHDGHRHGHSHGHHHGHHHGHSHARSGNKAGLAVALAITAGIMILEFVGGLWTNSLALLSDSGHMLSDVCALALSLAAIWFAARPASPKKTYGFYRFEILAALFNGVALFLIAGIILWEAYERFFDPPHVAGGTMIGIAAIGLLANLVSAWVLMRKGDVHGNVNVRSAYLHVVGDALGSLGAIGAGLLVWLFGWNVADPIISVFVSLLILRGAWGVIAHTVHILMEGTPAAVDQSEVRAALESIDGVLDVHDLHIWTITSSMDSLSCHLLIEDDRDEQPILQEAVRRIEQMFHIRHTTIQIEKSELRHAELEV